MRQDTTDTDDEIGGEHTLVDDDGHTGWQPTEITQLVMERVVAMHWISSHDVGTEFDPEFLTRDLPM
jgi:hypothetical protein